MASGFVDYLRMVWGWKSSPEVALAVVTERHTLVGASDKKFDLVGATNASLELVGTSDEKFTLTGA